MPLNQINNFINQSNQNGYFMPLSTNKPPMMDMNHTMNLNTANYTHSNSHSPQQHHQQQQYFMQHNTNQTSQFGPTKVLNLGWIQQSLKLPQLTENEVLSLARQAFLVGFPETDKIFIANQYCQRIHFNKMIFVLTEGFDAVVTIDWDSSSHKLIGDSSTFQQINTNQFLSVYNNNPNCYPLNQSSYTVNNNPQPLRPAVIQQQQPSQQSPEEKQQQQFIAYNHKEQKLIDTTSVESGDEECISEYDEILNEIISRVELDVDADPELRDEALPPLPPQLTINTNATTMSNISYCGEAPSLYNNSPPITSSHHLQLPQVNRLKTQTSFYSVNGDDNQSVITFPNTCKPTLQYVNSQNNVLDLGINGGVGGKLDNNNDHGIEISISNSLWNELYHRFYGKPGFGTKNDLISMIKSCIHHNGSPHQCIGDRKEWCVWVDRYYVYITEHNDMKCLVDVFDYHHFNNNNGDVIKSLKQRKYNIPSSAMKNNIKYNQHLSNFKRNTSARSILSNLSSKSVLSNADNNNNNNNKITTKKHEYHTIYLKPIIERMKAITFSMDGSDYASIDSDYIIDIVDNSIKFGVKRQISKRTFEFKWKSYTIIMSKSLKTILDVTLSTEKDIITVHPDVVSIISKKCPMLDYFTIQKVAKSAKLKASFTTKKNDYRQQFIYDYCGCRIVFASNHTTIVEMQCNDTSAISKFIKQ